MTFSALTPIRCLLHAAEEFGKSTGVVGGDELFSYREYLARCSALACALAADGLQRGDRVAFLSWNRHELLEAYFGVPMSGGILVPLNARLTPRETRELLADCGARWLFYDPAFSADIATLDLGSTVKAIELGAAFESWLAATPARELESMPQDEQSAALMFYTSGSTSKPKGVVLSHRALYLQALSIAGLYGKPGPTVFLHAIPLFHANGWGHPQALPLIGAKQVLIERFDPLSVLQAIDRHRVTDFCLVPTMAKAILEVPNLREYDLSSLRQILVGGSATSLELIAAVEGALGCRCYGSYGMTEAGPVITHARPKHAHDNLRQRATAGWCVPNVELKIVDEAGNTVPTDNISIGEIAIRSDHMMSGYWDASKCRPIPHVGWFHTGDMGRWDEDRFVEIVDRKTDMVIRGGENISSSEVEEVVQRVAGVLECAVVAAPDEYWGEVPVAIVLRSPDSQLSADELLSALQPQLAKFKLPARIEFSTTRLPRTSTGKIRKHELRERFWQGKDRRVQG